MSTRIEASALESFAAEVLLRVGLREADARLIAAKLVETNLRGVDSHGIMRLPLYVRRFKAEAMNVKPEIRHYIKTPVSALVDGDNGLGYVAADRAVDVAVKLAAESGFGIVAVINSNHFGAAGLYSTALAFEGLIGLSMSNTCPAMPAIGGSTPVVGNGPFSIALPRAAGEPVFLDISTSAGAYGKVLLAAKEGGSIPAGWAVDKEGIPTTDPKKAIESQLLLPFAGHKGFGIAFMIDTLCAGLGNSYSGLDVYNIYEPGFEDLPGRVSHVIAALRTDLFGAKDDFFAQVEAEIALVHGSDKAPGCDKIYCPGEREWETRLERQAEGIPISAGVEAELSQLAESLGIVALWKKVD